MALKAHIPSSTNHQVMSKQSCSRVDSKQSCSVEMRNRCLGRHPTPRPHKYMLSCASAIASLLSLLCNSCRLLLLSVSPHAPDPLSPPPHPHQHAPDACGPFTKVISACLQAAGLRSVSCSHGGAGEHLELRVIFPPPFAPCKFNSSKCLPANISESSCFLGSAACST